MQAGDFVTGVGERFAAQLCLEFGRLAAARQFAFACEAAAEGGVEGSEAFAVKVEVKREGFVVQFAVKGDAVVANFDFQRFDVVLAAVHVHLAMSGQRLFLPAAFEVGDVGGELDFAVFDAARAGKPGADFAFEGFQPLPLVRVQVFGIYFGVPADVRRPVAFASEMQAALQALGVELDVADVVQRVEGAAAFEGERREVFAARVAFDGNGESVVRAFAGRAPLSGGDDGVFRIADAQVFPRQFAVQLGLEQVAADAHVAVDVAADDGQEAVQGGGSDVQLQVGAGGICTAVGVQAVTGELEFKVAYVQFARAVVEAALAVQQLFLPVTAQALDAEVGVTVAAVGLDVAVQLQVEVGAPVFAVDAADVQGAAPGGRAAQIGFALVARAAAEGGECEVNVL